MREDAAVLKNGIKDVVADGLIDDVGEQPAGQDKPVIDVLF